MQPAEGLVVVLVLRNVRHIFMCFDPRDPCVSNHCRSARVLGASAPEPVPLPRETASSQRRNTSRSAPSGSPSLCSYKLRRVSAASTSVSDASSATDSDDGKLDNSWSSGIAPTRPPRGASP